MNTLSCKDFLTNAKASALIDIRIETEFQKGHFTDAVNLPFQIDLKSVRNLYRQNNNIQSISSFVENIRPWKNEIEKLLNIHSTIYLYCGTGGLRSYYCSEVLKGYVQSTVFLEGGYSSYCKFQKEYFAQLEIPNLCVLRGKTGCGKTEIIHHLAKQGEQVISLSALANHRGSAFGSYRNVDQPTNEQFYNDIFHKCFYIDLTKMTFIEQEGPFIGRVKIPESLNNKIASTKAIHINAPRIQRVKYLVQNYSNSTATKIMEGLKKLEKRLSKDTYQKAVSFLMRDEMPELASLLMSYYDDGFNYKSTFNDKDKSLNFSEIDPVKMAEKIIRCCDKNRRAMIS